MTKRLTAKVEEYQKDGQTKGKYIEIGVLMDGQNGEYLLLDPSISLAGVLAKQNALAATKCQPQRSSVMVSVFENSQQQQGWGQPQQPAMQQSQPAQQSQPQQSQPQYNEPPMDFDDDIPF